MGMVVSNVVRVKIWGRFKDSRALDSERRRWGWVKNGFLLLRIGRTWVGRRGWFVFGSRSEGEWWKMDKKRAFRFSGHMLRQACFPAAVRKAQFQCTGHVPEHATLVAAVGALLYFGVAFVPQYASFCNATTRSWVSGIPLVPRYATSRTVPRCSLFSAFFSQFSRLKERIKVQNTKKN